MTDPEYQNDPVKTPSPPRRLSRMEIGLAVGYGFALIVLPPFVERPVMVGPWLSPAVVVAQEAWRCRGCICRPEIIWQLRPGSWGAQPGRTHAKAGYTKCRVLQMSSACVFFHFAAFISRYKSKYQFLRLFRAIYHFVYIP
jgi:hypothetical protein